MTGNLLFQNTAHPRVFNDGSSSLTSGYYLANANNSRAWNWQLDENNNSALWSYNGSGWAKRATVTQDGYMLAGGKYLADGWLHSDRDFVDGTLIQTDIDYSVTNGDPFVLEIRGNSYGSQIPFDIQYQGYIYADTIINHGGYSNGTNITGLVAINYNGNLCFWFPRQSYWHGFYVRAYSAYATYPRQRVFSISNSGKPTTAKQVDLSANIRQSLHSGNYTNYFPGWTTGVAASNLVQRDNNGYIYANYINHNTSETENPTINSIFVSNGDGWTRKASKDHLISQMGLDSRYMRLIAGNSGSYGLNVSGQHAWVRFSQGTWGDSNPYAGNWSHVISFNAADDNRTFQIYGGDVPGAMYVRRSQGGAGTWHSWEKVLTSYNWSDYAAAASHTHSFDSLTSKSGGTGEYVTNGAFVGLYDGAYTWLRGWGLESNRETAYYRPTGNGTQTLYIGYAPGSMPWGTINLDATYLRNNGSIVLNASNYSSYALPLSGGTINGNLTVTGTLTAAGRNLAYSTTINMSSLDANTWYPVTIPLPANRRTTMRIENALNSNVPSWSNHGSGFSLYFEWISNGSGWGTIGVERTIVNWRQQFSNVTIVGGVTQMGYSSTEVIWLRGGGNYYFSADNTVSPSVQTSTYEVYGQSVSPSTSIQNDVWSQAGGKIGAYEFQAVGNMFAGGSNVVLHAGNYTNYTPSYSSGGGFTGQWQFYSNLGNYCGSLSGPGLQAYSTNNNSAFLSFHKGGHYAVNMGLDADNVLRIGGWSAAANRWQLDMDGNNTIPGRLTAGAWTTSGRNYSNEWIEFPNYSGLYSPNNGAHFYPNNATYGSWRVAGSRNGWGGLEFDSSNGNVSLMMGTDSNTTGFHNQSYGWQFRWASGALHVYKNAYGGGTDATVLDSSNYSSYALPLSGGTVSGSVQTETAASSWGVYSKTSGYGNQSGIWFSSNVGELLLRKADGSLSTRIAADGSYAFINNNNILHAGNYSSYALALSGGSMTGTISSYRSDTQRLFASYNTSASSPLQFYIDHSYGSVNIGNARGTINFATSGGLFHGGNTILTGANVGSYALALSGGTMTGGFAISNSNGYIRLVDSENGVNPRYDKTGIQLNKDGNSIYVSTSVTYHPAFTTWAPTGSQLMVFRQWSTNSEFGNISINGSGVVQYNTTSDYRLKADVVEVSGSGERLDALNPVEYTWIANGSRARGFLAHQFQQVYASSVTGEKDAVDAEGRPKYQAMQAGSAEVIADLVSEIQSLRKRMAEKDAAISSLIDRVLQLESK